MTFFPNHDTQLLVAWKDCNGDELNSPRNNTMRIILCDTCLNKIHTCSHALLFRAKYRIDQAESYRNILQKLFRNILSLVWFWVPLSLRPINMCNWPVSNSSRIDHLKTQSKDSVRMLKIRQPMIQHWQKFSRGKRSAGNVHQQCNCAPPKLAVITRILSFNVYWRLQPHLQKFIVSKIPVSIS